MFHMKHWSIVTNFHRKMDPRIKNPQQMFHVKHRWEN